jgi:hypothetical protein
MTTTRASDARPDRDRDGHDDQRCECDDPDHDGHDHGVPIVVKGKYYCVKQSPVTGPEVRHVAKVPDNRDLFLVVDGPAEDHVMDDDAVEIRPGARFYTAPCKINPGR